jgi:hypothetical protein
MRHQSIVEEQIDMEGIRIQEITHIIIITAVARINIQMELANITSRVVGRDTSSIVL